LVEFCWENNATFVEPGAKWSILEKKFMMSSKLPSRQQRHKEKANRK
jgi:hypothetical protein